MYASADTTCPFVNVAAGLKKNGNNASKNSGVVDVVVVAAAAAAAAAAVRATVAGTVAETAMGNSHRDIIT